MRRKKFVPDVMVLEEKALLSGTVGIVATGYTSGPAAMYAVPTGNICNPMIYAFPAGGGSLTYMMSSATVTADLAGAKSAVDALLTDTTDYTSGQLADLAEIDADLGCIIP